MTRRREELFFFSVPSVPPLVDLEPTTNSSGPPSSAAAVNGLQSVIASSSRVRIVGDAAAE